MQWLEDPNQRNIDNLKNVRHEVSRHFRNQKNAYLSATIDVTETYRKIKDIRNIIGI
jgi:hypothetical protein